MDAKDIATKITEAGSAKVQQQKPPAIDEAVVNKVIKQGAAELGSGVSKGNVDPAVGAAAEAAKHGKNPEVAAEVKAQLKEKIETKQDPLAEVIMEAGKAKLAKKPHGKQTELTSGDAEQTAKEMIFEAQSQLNKQQQEEHGGAVRGTDAARVQAIASRLEDPEHHTTPPVVEHVKDKVVQDHAAKASTSASGDSTAPKSTDTQNKNTGASSTRQEKLADTIVSEGLEQLNKRPAGKQAEVRQGTPAEVAKELAIEAGSSLTKKEFDEFGGLVRNSDATKLQSISDKLRLKDNDANPPEAVQHATEAVKQLGIAEGQAAGREE